MYKIQISLTDQENSLLAQRAAGLGYNVTKFIKFVISREAFSMAAKLPTISLSSKSEKKAEKALIEHKKGKSVELKNMNDLDSL